MVHLHQPLRLHRRHQLLRSLTFHQRRPSRTLLARQAHSSHRVDRRPIVGRMLTPVMHLRCRLRSHLTARKLNCFPNMIVRNCQSRQCGRQARHQGLRVMLSTIDQCLWLHSPIVHCHPTYHQVHASAQVHLTSTRRRLSSIRHHCHLCNQRPLVQTPGISRMYRLVREARRFSRHQDHVLCLSAPQVLKVGHRYHRGPEERK